MIRRNKLIALLILSSGIATQGFELWSDPNGVHRTDLDVAGKWTTQASHAPLDPVLHPERDSVSQYLRFRLGLDTHWHDRIDTQLAYEQRAFWLSDPVTGRTQLAAPQDTLYRVTPADWQIADHRDHLAYRHEIDRAHVAYHPDWGEVIAGRQAIGLGRGVIFSSLDLFAPFSPLDVDREWRRGVDALRAEYRLTDTSSAEVIGVFGETWEQSALLGRVRGYIGNMDGELIAGKRALDRFVGTSLSATLLEAEVHAECMLFHTPEVIETETVFSNDHTALKAVLGASYTFDVGSGLSVLGEYQYNGFGVEDASQLNLRMLDQAFQRRILYGDMQTLGQDALALQCGYLLGDSVSMALLLLNNPGDHSGLAIPNLVWDINSSMRLLGSVYLPWGDPTNNGQIQSEYGGTPLSALIQLAAYR